MKNNESEFTDEYVLKLQGQLEEKTYLYNKLQTESKYVIDKYKQLLDKIKEIMDEDDSADNIYMKLRDYLEVTK